MSNFKIALLGNTCNNNFAIMRYLRHLGIDTHLLLYSSDGLEGLAVINNPEWDTWDIAKWDPFIKRLPFPNGLESVIGRPDLLRCAPSKKRIFEAVNGYDFYIGGGMSPAILKRIDKRLTIFYPYATGVEWVGDEENAKKLRTYNFEWPFRAYVRNLQIKGIQSASTVICPAFDSTAETLTKIRVPFVKLPVPQIYNLEDIPFKVDSEAILYLKAMVSDENLIVFSHMRHHWVCGDSYEPASWFRENKNNHWLMFGFHRFLERFPKSKAKLILIDWGKDVRASKALCAQLGIDRNIIWLPILKRKEIFWILKHCCTIAVGDFVCSPGEYWGSTAFEALSVGVPVMQTVNFNDKTFRELFGSPLPLFLDVKNDLDVAEHLAKVFLNPHEIRTKFLENTLWFNKYNGLNLAKKWLDLIVARKAIS